MMISRLLLPLQTLLAVLVAAPASACMADGPEGYVSGLIWENRHTNIPDQAMVLKVEVPRSQPESAPGLVVRVIEGPPDLAGSTINVVPANGSSCVGLGRLTGYVVVRERPARLETAPENLVYVAVDYLPAPHDRSRGMRRETNWFYPGEPAPEEELPLEVEASG